jgi:EmrB/QacA subfamily drug resistance transporter
MILLFAIMRPVPAAESRRRSLVLGLCCIAQFMVVLDISIVNVALPAIQSDLGFTGPNLQWAVNAYTLTFAGFLLLGGRAGDLFGRREVFAFGLGLFALASLAGGLAESQATLLAARAAQGLGGAIVAPASLSILATTFTEGAERNRALGLWGAMGGVGGAAGGLLGGLLTEQLSWRWTLLINVPFGIAVAAGALAWIARGVSRSSDRKAFDLSGAITITAALVVLTYGIVETDQHAWGSARTLTTFALGLALLGAFLIIERFVASAPLMPLRIFRSRQVSGANAVALCLGGGAFTMWYFTSLYFQDVLGYSPLQAGWAYLPMTMVLIWVSQYVSRHVVRLGSGVLLAGGMATLAVGLLGFARLPADASFLVDVLAPSIIVAIGVAIAFVTISIAANSGVPREDAGLASGMINSSRQIGGSIGLALLVTVASRHTAELDGVGHAAALAKGYDRAFLLGAIFSAIGALLSLGLLVRRRPMAQVTPA